MGCSQYRVCRFVQLVGHHFHNGDHSANLSSALTTSPQDTLKRHIFTADVGVQTESSTTSSHIGSQIAYEDAPLEESEEDEARSLPASDLAAVLKWSKDISRNIHLFAGPWLFSFFWLFLTASKALQRLTEIAIGESANRPT